MHVAGWRCRPRELVSWRGTFVAVKVIPAGIKVFKIVIKPTIRIYRYNMLALDLHGVITSVLEGVHPVIVRVVQSRPAMAKPNHPVTSADRLGEQVGFTVKALRNKTPS